MSTNMLCIATYANSLVNQVRLLSPLRSVPSQPLAIISVFCSLCSISVKPVVRALTQFISTFGIPHVIQSDQVSNFTSHMFKQILCVGISCAEPGGAGTVPSDIEVNVACAWYGGGEGLGGGAAMAHVGGQGSHPGKYQV